MDKEKNQLDLLGWLKFLFQAWTGCLSTFLILLWDRRSVSHLSAWPCKCIQPFTRGGPGGCLCPVLGQCLALGSGGGSVPRSSAVSKR